MKDKTFPRLFNPDEEKEAPGTPGEDSRVDQVYHRLMTGFPRSVNQDIGPFLPAALSDDQCRTLIRSTIGAILTDMGRDGAGSLGPRDWTQKIGQRIRQTNNGSSLVG